MTTTPRLGLELIDDDEVLGYVSANEAIERLERLVQPTVIRRDLATPPGSPVEGDQYIVASAPTGAWTGHATHLATYLGATWLFVTPSEGWHAYDQNANEEVVFSGTAWVIFPGGGGGGGSGSMTSLGLNMAAPATAGQLAQTLGANNITGTLIKRFTDTSPTGHFVDYQTAAGVSVASMSITGDLAAKTATLQPLTNGTVLDVKNAAGSSRVKFDSTAPGKLTIAPRILADTGAGFFDFGFGGHQIVHQDLAPTTVRPVVYLHGNMLSDGSTSTAKGLTGLWIDMYDDASLVDATRGVLQGMFITVNPRVSRHSPGFDWVTALSIQNLSTFSGEAALAFITGRGGAWPPSSPVEWTSNIELGTYVYTGILYDGKVDTYGIDFHGTVGTALWGSSAVLERWPNNIGIAARNNADSADVPLFKLNTNNLLEVQTAVPSLPIRDTSAAFDVTIGATSSVTLGANRALTLDMQNVAHTLKLPANADTITFPAHLGSAVTLPGTLSKTRPNETINNSAASPTSVDFASIYTIPANMLTAGTHLRVELDFTYTMSGSPTTSLPILKLGGTTVFTGGSVTLAAGSTRHVSLILNIYGTASPGGSVNVEVSPVSTWTNNINHNMTATQALATNGTLTVVPGCIWGATGSADAITLRNATITRLN